MCSLVWVQLNLATGQRAINVKVGLSQIRWCSWKLNCRWKKLKDMKTCPQKQMFVLIVLSKIRASLWNSVSLFYPKKKIFLFLEREKEQRRERRGEGENKEEKRDQKRKKEKEKRKRGGGERESWLSSTPVHTQTSGKSHPSDIFCCFPSSSLLNLLQSGFFLLHSQKIIFVIVSKSLIAAKFDGNLIIIAIDF